MAFTQQVLGGDAFLQLSPATSIAKNSSKSCIRHAWNSRDAGFDPCALPYIAAVPTAVSILVVLFHLVGLAVRWRPQWTKRFVVEPKESLILDELSPRRRWSFLSLLLTFVSCLGFAVQLAAIIRSWKSFDRLTLAAPWFIVLGLMVVFRYRTVPYSVLVVLLVQAVAQIIVLRGEVHLLDKIDKTLSISGLSLSGLACFCILFMPLRDPYTPAKDISHPFSEPTSFLRSPEDNLTLWQYMTVAWMTPLMRRGRERQLDDEDVWQLPYEFQHQRLHANFRLLKGTVVQRLIRANIIDIIILVLFGFVEVVLQYSTPILLQQILASIEDDTIPQRTTVAYAGIALLLRLARSQLAVFSLWHERRCYERSRGEMITMLYEKTLGRKISFGTDEESDEKSTNGVAEHESQNGNPPKSTKQGFLQRTWNSISGALGWNQKPSTAKKPASMGKILNLMRNDVYEVAQRFWEIQSLVVEPLSIVFAMFLVIKLLGPSSLIAILLILVAQCINAGLARVMVYFEKKRRIATDDKLQLISQFIEAIRHLRWYGWQSTWLVNIIGARQKELILRNITALWNNVLITFVNVLSLDMSPLVAFYAYTVIAGKPLRVDLAFPAVDVLEMLSDSLQRLPELILVLVNAWVAVGRIEDFMAEPDKKDMNTEAVEGTEMMLKDATFAWPGQPGTVLREINLKFPQGLTVISGEVAAGKSALLQALLGELDMIEGQLIRPNESIAYCAQTPWLQIMSIRENILFGAPYDDNRYKSVLDACALNADLAEFRAGDLSLIGENGIGLSGGQRARVALARALYSRAKIMLLDDPLSALDQQTAESVASKSLKGSLAKGRTIVLVTHRTDLVNSFARLMIQVEDGRASELDMSSEAYRAMQLQRINSKDDTTEAKPSEQVADVVPDKFIEDEHRSHGNVRFSVYWTYIKAGNLKYWALLTFFLIIWRILFIGATWFLKEWAEAYNDKPKIENVVAIRLAKGSTSWNPIDRLPSPAVNIYPWVWGYFAITLAQIIFYLISQSMMILIWYTAAKGMFTAVIHKVTGAKFRFYDVTPIGRLMNRMTSDIATIDGIVTQRFYSVTNIAISWLSSILIIGTVTPAFLAFAVILVIAFVYVFTRFLPASQSLRRLEMVSLTPLMSNFGTLLTGLSTVRAFKVQQQFQDRVVQVVDTFQKMDHFYWSLQSWLMYRYDTLSGISTFLMTMLALATDLSAGMTAFVLIAADRFVNNTPRLCKQYGQLQMEFVSVERVIELLDVEQEPEGEVKPPAWWPSSSADIVFEDVTIRYAPHLDPALTSISLTIKAGSKTAVIGRTGSGKSTLALSMLATILPETGRILVDNIDLAKVDRQLLRTRVTFLAQDPVLFPGTMRQNLDPVNEHSDEECELVLRRVCERQGWNLDTKIESGGQNLSQGQRQLVGLARAVLRRSAIIILDEATASIDRETAEQIQQIMHEEMRESTVITIAHRLEAVKNADYCIVLGQGKVLRQGPSAEMLDQYRSEMTDEDEQ